MPKRRCRGHDFGQARASRLGGNGSCIKVRTLTCIHLYESKILPFQLRPFQLIGAMACAPLPCRYWRSRATRGPVWRRFCEELWADKAYVPPIYSDVKVSRST